MAERREDTFRHVLPIGHQRVRRRLLDSEAGEGTSQQPHAAERPIPTPPRLRLPNIAAVTPKRYKGVIRGIRRNIAGLKGKAIENYLEELERLEKERDGTQTVVIEGWTSSESDISVDEDSGDEYRPPGERRGEGSAEGRHSDADFSGFSALDEDGGGIFRQ